MARRGWSILARNYRRVGTELDIVARKDGTVAVVEVKARRAMPRDAADACSLLPPRKLAALQRGAEAFLAAHDVACTTVRFDLAIVVGDARDATATVQYLVDVAR